MDSKYVIKMKWIRHKLRKEGSKEQMKVFSALIWVTSNKGEYPVEGKMGKGREKWQGKKKELLATQHEVLKCSAKYKNALCDLWLLFK